MLLFGIVVGRRLVGRRACGLISFETPSLGKSNEAYRGLIVEVVGEFEKLFARTPTRLPVGYVALFGKPGEFENTDGRCARQQRVGNIERMLAAGLVVVHEYDRSLAFEVAGEFRRPITRTEWSC